MIVHMISSVGTKPQPLVAMHATPWSSRGPWSDIISKYLNGTAENQLTEHKDLIDIAPSSHCRQSDTFDLQECNRRRHSRHHQHHHHYKHRRHHTSRKNHKPYSHQMVAATYQPLESHSFARPQLAHVALVPAQPAAGVVWAAQPPLQPGVDSPTMILGNSLNTLKAAPQATPCFLTLPLGMNMSNAGVIPVTTGLSVQPSIHHVPVQEFQPSIHLREGNSSSTAALDSTSHTAFSDQADKLTQSTTDDDLLLSADAVSEIFGGSLDLESAEDAEERYQQLFETERMMSRDPSTQSQK